MKCPLMLPSVNDDWELGVKGRHHCMVKNLWTVFYSCLCSVVLHHSVCFTQVWQNLWNLLLSFCCLLLVTIMVGKALKHSDLETKYYAKERAWLTTTIFTKFLRVLSALTCVKGTKICYWQTVCCSYARCIISVGSTICLCMTSGFCHNVNYICALLDITQCWLVAQNWSNVYWTVHHCNSWGMKNQLDVTCYFISLIMRSTCFGHSYIHLQEPAKWTPPKTSRSKNSNTQRTENKMTELVIHQHCCRLLKMDILMSETCWAHIKWNKIASDIKLVFHSSKLMFWALQPVLKHLLLSINATWHSRRAKT